jgi:hypothetical protein
LKITGILNNVLRPQKPLKKKRIKLYNTLALPAKLGLLKQGTLEEYQQQR